MTRLASLAAALVLAVLIPSAALAATVTVKTDCAGEMPGDVFFSGIPQGDIVMVGNSTSDGFAVAEFPLSPGTYTWTLLDASASPAQSVLKSNTVETGSISIQFCPTPPPTGTAPVAPESPSTPFGIVVGIFVAGLFVVVLLGRRR